MAFADTNFTYFPAPTWAGVLKTQLTEKHFFNIGAYEVAPDSTLRTDHGVDFFEPATGFNVPFELGYATTFKNDTMPRHYGVAPSSTVRATQMRSLISKAASWC